ncbi:TetR/AcrR family transcriptional regulator [Streptacidiphilus monticola]|uniref:TetR family transcriptional regulator n=1 Tax=Streptacidiphilus monticola TaxID=2161674 RepID=A0ABW1G279_9ACTN
MSEHQEQPPPARRPGRRPGGPDTRRAVLEAARAEFAAHGYEKASMRGIARAADVNAALLHHYFGSKDQLFLAALDFPVDPQVVAPLILAGDRAEVGERLARFVVSLWAQPEVRDRLLAVLRTVTSSEEVAALVRGFVVRELVGRVAEGLRLPDAELRVEFALAQILGLALARYVVRVEPVASAGADELVALLAPTLQLYLGGEA